MALAAWLLAPKEPKYNGKRVSEWIVTMPKRGASWNLLKAKLQRARGEARVERAVAYREIPVGTMVIKTSSQSLVAQDLRKSPVPTTRTWAAPRDEPAWGAIGHFGTNALPYLIEALKRQPSWFDPVYKKLWENCPVAWRTNRFNPPRPAVEIRRNAAALLVVLGNHALPALPEVIRALDDPDPDVRLFATYFVEIQRADGAPAMLAVTKNLGHADEMLRMESLEALDKMRLNEAQVATVLENWPDLQNSSRWFVPRLLEYQRFGPVSCSMLMRAATTADILTRLRAFTALQAASTNAFFEVPRLIRMLDSPQRGLQLQAMWTLEKIGPAAEAAIPKLERLEKNENALIANTAANTLVYVRRPVK